MEDDLNFFKNGRRPKFSKMEGDLNFSKIEEDLNFSKIEDDLNFSKI